MQCFAGVLCFTAAHAAAPVASATTASASATIATAPGVTAPEVTASWIRFELDIPLTMLAADLEQRLPRGRVPEKRALPEGYELEVVAWRDPVTLAANGDTLVVRSQLHYTLHIQSDTQPRVGCGTQREPLHADMGCQARFGWNDAWGLEAIARPRPIIYDERCKPKPPNINLGKRAAPVLNASFVDSLAPAAAKTAGAIACRDYIETVWTALARGIALGEERIEFAPEAVVVEPVQFSASALAVRGAVRVRPRVEAEKTARTASVVPFPKHEPTRVRLPGDEFGIAVQVTSSLVDARDRVEAALDSAAAGLVRNVAIRADERALTIQFDAGTEKSVRYAATAAMEFTNYPPDVVVPNPRWTDASAQAIARLPADAQARMQALLPVIGAATRIEMDAAIAAAARNLGANLTRRLGDGLRLDGGLNHRRPLGLRGTGDEVVVDLVLLGHARVQPYRAAP